MPVNPSRSFNFPPRAPAESALAGEAERLRDEIRRQHPTELAALAGAEWIPGEEPAFVLDLWGESVRVGFPDLVAVRMDGSPLPLPVQALLMFYLRTSDGFPLAGEWVSFADLPGGRMYAQAFQGYSGNLLARAFGEDSAAFRRACEAAGGVPEALGEAAYRFAGLPRVPLLVTYWVGDEDFPSTSKVLFDRGATHHLPIDVCAVLGSMLVSRILKSRAYK